MTEARLPKQGVGVQVKGDRSGIGSLWQARDDAIPFSGHPDEVAIISMMTGKSAIEVRLAIMKVGTNRDRILAELHAYPEASGQDP